MTLDEVVRTSEEVGATRARKQKILRLAALLAGRTPDALALAVGWLAGEPRQGKVGVGYATAEAARDTPPAATSTLTAVEVDAAFDDLTGIQGPGSTEARASRLAALLARATAAEQRFLLALLTGELRQGALEGIMADALAEALAVPADAVRRAAMFSGDLAAVARAAAEGGEPALRRFGVQLFRPLQPMLASPADDVEAALDLLGRAGLEYKMDGVRVQVHRQGDRVRVFTRGLKDVTKAAPEVVELARSLPGEALVLDGEVLALDPDGRPRPFQTTMRRFGRRIEFKTAELRDEVPLTPFFFDALHLDGADLVDAPTADRVAALAERVPPAHRVPRAVVDDAAAAQAFLKRAIDAGHEGIMAKHLEAGYAAGGRGSAWLKLKPTYTLDLVVLAAEWGSGRRKGWLSNLHLGARDPDGGFVMLGKTFKGLTDEVLAWQTEHILARETGRDGHVVFCRPELVVEIAFNEVQQSPKYPGGMALRFARVKGYRPDKTAAEADTVEAVRAIFEGAVRPMG